MLVVKIELAAKEKPQEIFPDALYECVRCGTRVEGKELARFPEPTCANCGYKVFRKVRRSSSKQLKAE